MKPVRLWPRVLTGVVVLAAGVYMMGTEVGNAQWVVGLIVAILGAALLTSTAIVRRRARTGSP